MWIVVVVNEFYPSVLHFENKENAEKRYLELTKERAGTLIHLAKLEKYKFDKKDYRYESQIGDRNENEIKLNEFDVKWYI